MNEFESLGSCSGSDPIALQVLDDSMEPEFPKGCIIVIDPSGVIENDAYVFAKYEGEFIFRQLKIDLDENGAKRYRLVATNGDHPELPLPGVEAIHGRIVQRAGRRRKDRKHYI
ncbi:MAG TPA: S24 family peptidase [Gammaproteobacteria bacterium]|nr:S24 family peptidase [Gammaproteobacteria bacterium]